MPLTSSSSAAISAGGVRRSRASRLAAVRRDVADDGDELFERAGHGAGESARAEHGAAERQQDERSVTA